MYRRWLNFLRASLAILALASSEASASCREALAQLLEVDPLSGVQVGTTDEGTSERTVPNRSARRAQRQIAEPSLQEILNGLRGEKPIGSGGEADVYLIKVGGKLVIVKVYNNEKLKEWPAEAIIWKAKNEYRLMKIVFERHKEDPPSPKPQQLSENCRPAMTMDYVKGKTLRENMLERKKSGTDMKAELGPLFAKLIEAVAKIEQAGVSHRDIKPTNVMIDESGKVWVLDYGVAVELKNDPIDFDADAAGTPAYGHPRQFHPFVRENTPHVDKFALANTLIELLLSKAVQTLPSFFVTEIVAGVPIKRLALSPYSTLHQSQMARDTPRAELARYISPMLFLQELWPNVKEYAESYRLSQKTDKTDFFTDLKERLNPRLEAPSPETDALMLKILVSGEILQWLNENKLSLSKDALDNLRTFAKRLLADDTKHPSDSRERYAVRSFPSWKFLTVP